MKSFKISIPPELENQPQDPPGGDGGRERDREFEHGRRKMSYQEDVCLYWVRVAFLVLGSLLTFGVIFVFISHLIMPISWRWLDDSELVKLKDIAVTIIVGLLMSAITAYFFKRKK